MLTYIVRPGDTPRRIALRFRVSYSSLIAINPGWREYEPLIAGELANIPVRLPRRYACRDDDTMEKLAKLSNCSLERLRELNPHLGEQGEPEEDQLLELPDSSADRIVQADAEYGPRQMDKDLQRMKRNYPFLSVSSIGRSVLGKPLHAIRIGEGPFRWHFNGACHANEWITSLLLMRFAEDYCRACHRKASIGGYEATDLFRRTTLWIVPMLNPDGVELVQEGLAASHPLYKDLVRANSGSSRFHRWKANARGVDLNDQFPAGWQEERERRAVIHPGPKDYSGKAPLTEPEAKALAEWTEQSDFHAVLSLHTQGEEIYWNYHDEEPPESMEWAQRLARASGYRAVKLIGSDAGYKDWFIHAYRRPGFTVEAGWGHNPLPLEAFEEMYDDCLRLFAEALNLANL
jgi:g-D-glutamyl-meso-diaminopimelate peptidase